MMTLFADPDERPIDALSKCGSVLRFLAECVSQPGPREEITFSEAASDGLHTILCVTENTIEQAVERICTEGGKTCMK